MTDAETEHAIAVLTQRLWLALCSDPEKERAAFDALGIKSNRFVRYERLRDQVQTAASRIGFDELRSREAFVTALNRRSSVCIRDCTAL